ncbi:hypothetical protein HAZT_HAZT010366, partial [Hyalella azteca]
MSLVLINPYNPLCNSSIRDTRGDLPVEIQLKVEVIPVEMGCLLGYHATAAQPSPPELSIPSDSDHPHRSSWGDESIAEVECPISGVFTFTYERGKPTVGHGFDDPHDPHGRDGGGVLCPRPTSEMSNCPYGFGLNVHYRDCAYGQPDQLALQCLGGWRGAGGQHYMAVLDTSVGGADPGPRYRCA